MRKYLQRMGLTRTISKRYKQLIRLDMKKKKINPKKGAEDMNKHFPRETH